MKKWIARTVLILLLLAAYGGFFWGYLFLVYPEGALRVVWQSHAAVVGAVIFVAIVQWASRNSKWKVTKQQKGEHDG